MYELELFAGAGGGILAQQILGHHTVGAVEIEPYCRTVLLQRQRDLCLPVFPVWDDITTFRSDNPDCAGYIHWLCSIRDELCISGGFPCQDISSCGKGAGIAGKKSGLWHEMARVVAEIRPAFVFAENSPMLAGRGLGVVLGTLAALGYDAKWCVLGADDLGYPIIRKRIWILGMRLLRSTYGAQIHSLHCRMLRAHDLFPTVLLCETLMGWPAHWSRSEPLATVRYRQWLLLHGGSSQAA